MNKEPQEAELVTTALTRQDAGTLMKSDPLAGVAGMMQTVLDKGVTADNVAVMEKLVGLFERLQDKNAEQQFNAAFVALQQEMPRVQANRPVMNSEMKGGGLRYRFAPYEDIMAQVRPFLIKHGFTVSYSQRCDGPRIIVKCVLRHISGHQAENECAVRIGKGPPGSSETQGDGAASTYAKRFALCDALNIVIGKDSDGMQDDASVEGDAISVAEAVELRERVRNTRSDELKFLELAQSPVSDSATDEDVIRAYQNIRRGNMPVLDGILKSKEAKKR